MTSSQTTHDEHISDESLATESRTDPQAFSTLMQRYFRHVYNFARQYAKRGEDCDDITQDTFYKVWKNLNKYEDGKKFRPWLFTIARNTALDFLKKKRAAVFSDLDDTENDLSFADTLEDDEPLPSEIFENKELAGELTAALDHINPDHRAILTLHYQDNLTFEEIATIIGKPMNTVKSWHRRSLIRIRDILAKKRTMA